MSESTFPVITRELFDAVVELNAANGVRVVELTRVLTDLIAELRERGSGYPKTTRNNLYGMADRADTRLAALTPDVVGSVSRAAPVDGHRDDTVPVATVPATASGIPHRVTVTVAAGGGLRVTFTCTAPIAAPCRLGCSERCASSRDGDTCPHPQSRDEGFCVPVAWLTEDRVGFDTYTGPPANVHSGPIIIHERNGNEYEWVYADD